MWINKCCKTQFEQTNWCWMFALEKKQRNIIKTCWIDETHLLYDWKSNLNWIACIGSNWRHWISFFFSLSCWVFLYCYAKHNYNFIQLSTWKLIHTSVHSTKHTTIECARCGAGTIYAVHVLLTTTATTQRKNREKIIKWTISSFPNPIKC